MKKYNLVVPLCEADLLENYIDHITTRYEQWVLTGHEEKTEIKKFVNWMIAQDQIDLHKKRSPDKKSFYDRRLSR